LIEKKDVLIYYSLYFAIELDLMVTKVDYWLIVVVDSLEIDFVLVDLFVDQVMMNYKMDNVVDEQQVLLVDIVNVVVIVVLKEFD
jgi:hypothetical protein